jgi:hypothetical protein
MGFAWRDSADVLRSMLRGRGQDPDAVRSTAEAWRAFADFLGTPVDGICRPVEDYDSDGFILQWGRTSWSSDRQSLTFTRQLAVAGKDDDKADEHWQPEYWQVNLELVYDDTEEIRDEFEADTGFYFFDGAESLSSELADVRDTCVPLRTAMRLAPLSSALTFDRAE